MPTTTSPLKKNKPTLSEYKSVLRLFLISIKAVKLIRLIDTFMFVYTIHALIILANTTIMITANAFSTNAHLSWNFNIALIFSVIIIVTLIHLFMLIIKELKRISNLQNSPIFYVHAQGDILRCKKGINGKKYFLGTGITGIPLNINLFVHCISQHVHGEPHLIPVTTSSVVEIEIQKELFILGSDTMVNVFHIKIIPKKPHRDVTKIQLRITNVPRRLSKITLKINSIVEYTPDLRVIEIKPKGWKYGKEAAVCWRADFCYLHPKKGMRVETLQQAYRLSRKYGIPMTLFISGRLSLDFEEYMDLIRHYKFYEEEYATAEFIKFNEYIKSLPKCQINEYPNFKGAIAIGSHSYLHQGGFIGATKSNNWNEKWKLVEGEKRWLTSIALKYGLTENEINQLTFHQLNELINIRLLYKVLGVTPQSWSAPRNETIHNLALELERIGIIYTSEADNYPRISKTFFPRRPESGPCFPYHPSGCRTLIESRCVINPCDPVSVHDLFSLYKTLKYSIKNGYQACILIHPHLMVHKNRNGPKLVERLFQKICEDLDHLWVATHEAILEYWELTKCEIHSALRYDLENNLVKNVSNKKIENVSLYIRLNTGEELIRTLSIEPQETINIFTYSPNEV
jgi:hypothetical protein